MTGSTLGVPNSAVDKLHNTPFTRILPIKRYDGEPLIRSDLQHNLLNHIFNDQTRCFTNPRPKNIQEKVPNYFATPVYPYGNALGCFRRSDETKEEFEKWKSDYEDWQKKRNQDGSDGQQEGQSIPSTSTSSSGEKIEPGTKYLTFKELYIEAILNSQRCSKNMRDKLVADPEYAEDFAKVCLLVNVGKMNTTLAFYPEMKTILRSYHPLPSLQGNENTRKTMQDAPRIKSILKSGLLIHEEPQAVSSRSTSKSNSNNPSSSESKPNNVAAVDVKTAKVRKAAAKNAEENNFEMKEVPNTLDSIFQRFNEKNNESDEEKRSPVTSITTLIFILSTLSEELTALHFDNEKKKKKKGYENQEDDEEEEFLIDEDKELKEDEKEREGEDFLSIFYPKKNSYLSSKSRAKSFLWLIWNYYEGSNRLPFLSSDLIPNNPFNDEHSLKSEKNVLSYYKSLNEEEKENLNKLSNGRWKGLENPEGLNWLRNVVPEQQTTSNKSSSSSSIASNNKNKSIFSKKSLPELINMMERDGAPSLLYETCPTSKFGHPPPLFKKRLLAPKFETISKEAWENENIDSIEELEWGKEMKEVRNKFLLDFAGNEQKKALASREKEEDSRNEIRDGETREASILSSVGGVGVGKIDDEEDELISDRDTPAPTTAQNPSSGSGKGKRKASSSNLDNSNGGDFEGRKVVKRFPQGNSSYPLANILAQAHLTAQGISPPPPPSNHNSTSTGGGEGSHSSSLGGPSSSKMQINESKDRKEFDILDENQSSNENSSNLIPGKQYLVNEDFQISNLKNLFSLDLRYPKTLGSSSSSSSKPKLLHFDSEPTNSESRQEELLLSLTSQAWNRILNRARKGVGDASYESDDDEILLDDAIDECPRGELSRILRSLRCLRGIDLDRENNDVEMKDGNGNGNERGIEVKVEGD